MIDELLKIKPQNLTGAHELMMLVYLSLSREGWESGMSINEIREFVFDWLKCHAGNQLDDLIAEMIERKVS